MIASEIKNCWFRFFCVMVLTTLLLSGICWGQQVAQPKSEAPAQSLKARITNVTGKSAQISLSTGKAWDQAKVGTELGTDASVRTGFGSSCEVTFGEHTVVQVDPLSSMRVADYSGRDDKEKVRANLQYGAVRCGVEQGRVKADTKISTPVSTLSIRGTFVHVEFDRGTRHCLFRVDEDGPALASLRSDCRCNGKRGTRTDDDQCDCPEDQNDQLDLLDDPNDLHHAGEGDYVLAEGMKTDCSLARYLRTAVFERAMWSTGDAILTDSETAVYNDQVINPNEGALNNNTPQSINAQQEPSCVVVCYF